MKGSIKKVLRFTGMAWQVLGVAAVVVSALFLAWKIPLERREEAQWRRQGNLNDGPHVFRLDESHVKIARVTYDRAARLHRAHEEVVTIAPGSQWLKVPEGDLPLNPPGFSPPPAPSHGPGAAKIAAISDIHGQYQQFRKMLARAAVIDGDGNWSWGGNHLVIAGDVFDKGPSVTEVLWLIKRLERQARQSGGQVHFLLGNHDHLSLRGESVTVRAKYSETSGALRMRFQDLFGPETELGRWLRSRNVVARIDDWLFVHAGISEPLLSQKLSMEELNRVARLRLDPSALAKASLRDRELADLVGGPSGLLAYRGYFDSSFPVGFVKAFRGTREDAEEALAVVEGALRFYGCKRMVIGHTYVRRIRTMFGGQIVAICRTEGGDDYAQDEWVEMLLIEGGQAFRLDLQGARDRL